MKVLLIAGKGPLRLSQNDLLGTFFDDSTDDSCYYVSSLSYKPTDLIFESSGENVLKKKKNITPELIVSTLRTILDAEKINHDFLSIKSIWSNENVSLNHYGIVCLSTTFMWSESMLDYSIGWINRHLSYDYLIVGGQYATLKYDYILSNHKTVNFISTGDADISLVPLIKALFQHGDISKIPDIMYLKNGVITKTKHNIVSLENRILPRFKGVQNVVPYISMKGCVFHCAFCAQSACCPEFLYKSADSIYSDWLYYKNQNKCKHFDIHDSTFFIPYARIRDLLSKIQDLNITWEANIRSDTPITLKDVSSLEKSGCIALFFGFESMSNDVLRHMNKKTSSNDNRRMNDLFINSTIETTMSFIIGFPGETDQDFQLTREYLLHEHVGFFTVNVFELEDETMPIFKQKERFNIEVLPPKKFDDDKKWIHGGTNWTHCGMSSEHAFDLREQLIKDIRLSNSFAVYRSWQYDFEFPFFVCNSKKDNLYVEKLIDRLVFLPKDFLDDNSRNFELKGIVSELRKYGIIGKRCYE